MVDQGQESLNKEFAAYLGLVKRKLAQGGQRGKLIDVVDQLVWGGGIGKRYKQKHGAEYLKTTTTNIN
jgi:hypothetical protein